MPTCSNCGRENLEGYRFCQGCGTPLGKRPPSREVAQVQTCKNCGNPNGPGMKFCSNCGTPLVAVSEGKPSTVTCPSCGGVTPRGFSFCQQCGTPLPDAKQPAAAAPAARGAAEQLAGEPNAQAPQKAAVLTEGSPTPPAGMPPKIDAPVAEAAIQQPATEPPIAPPTEPPAVDLAKVPTAATPEAAPVSTPFAKETPAGEQLQPAGEQLQSVPAPPPTLVPDSALAPKQPLAPKEPPAEAASGQLAEDAPAPEPSVGGVTVGPGAQRRDMPQQQREVLARLISVRRDGSDGDLYELTEEVVDLGRTEGQLTFPEDPYLSERHCRFAVQDGSWVVQDLGSRNGVFLRIAETVQLLDGDILLLGKQVLRFDLLSETERNLAPAVEHGVMILGSPLREPWGRLRQLTVAGVSRDIHYLYRPKVALGREDGDLIFPDDEFMSRQHMAISVAGGKVHIQDVGSSNGTFVRIRDEPRLRNREMLRIGDQLLRFELA